MNSKDLKASLKPIVKELVYECLIKEGILSSVVSEVMKGVSTTQVIAEQRTVQPKKQTPKLETNEEAAARRKKLEETLMSKIGINVFEGTKPLNTKGNTSDSKITESKASPLANIDPSDPGVDISGLLRLTGGWKQI